MNVAFKDGYNLIGRVSGARERLFEVYSFDTIDGG